MPTHALCNRNRRSNQLAKPGVICTTCNTCSKCGHQANHSNYNVTAEPPLITNATLSEAEAVCALCDKPIAYFRESLPCGHTFHGDCLFRWLKRNVTQPKVKNVCPWCGLLSASGEESRSVLSRQSSASSGSRRTSESDSGSECGSNDGRRF